MSNIDKFMQEFSSTPHSLRPGCMFIMGDFPSPDQTLLLEEMKTLQEMGLQINVLAKKKVNYPEAEKEIVDIQHRAIYLPSKIIIAFRLFVAFFNHPFRFINLVKWAIRLPHRTTFHRARFLGALMYAIAMAPSLSRLRIKRFHAHFSGFQTELAMCLSRILDIPYSASWHVLDIWKNGNILNKRFWARKL